MPVSIMDIDTGKPIGSGSEVLGPGLEKGLQDRRAGLRMGLGLVEVRTEEDKPHVVIHRIREATEEALLH